MEELGPATEHDVVLAFLQAEVDSPRWRPTVLAVLTHFGASRALLDRPDLTNATENHQRILTLANTRGYRANLYLFARLCDHRRPYGENLQVRNEGATHGRARRYSLVFITASDDVELDRSVVESGDVTLLRKLYSNDALLEAVSAALGRAPYGPS